MTWQRALGFLVAAVFAAGLGIGAFLPGEIIRPYVGGEGQFHHLVGLWVIVFVLTLTTPRAWRGIVGAGFTLSGVVELAQPLFGRGAQLSDFAAGVVGLLLGVGAGLLCVKVALNSQRER